MIDVICPQCHRAFSVADALAGRRARCKNCNTPLTIPDLSRAAATTPPTTPKVPPRIRRLRADAEQMNDAFANFPLIRMRHTTGQPPELYELEYFVRGLERLPGRKDPIERAYHIVQIQLVADYPRLAPKCRMLTPIFHPNIEPATICVGDHWTAGERLVDLVIRIGEMLAYQAYNIKSPLDGEAAMWADLNPDKLPTDARNVRPGGVE